MKKICTSLDLEAKKGFGVLSWTFSFYVLFTFLMSSNAYAHSLKEAIEAALESNPKIKAYEVDIKLSELSMLKSFAGFLPNLNIKFQDGDFASRTFGDLSALESSLSITQNVFRGFADLNGSMGTKSLIEASKQEIENSKGLLLLDVAKTYFEVIKQKEIVSMRLELLSVFQKELKISRKRFELGEITKQDIAKSRFELAKARTDLLVSKNNLDNAFVSYKTLTGLDPETISGTLDSNNIKKPESLKSALELSEKRNPLLQARYHYDMAFKRKLDASYGHLLPSVDIAMGAKNIKLGGFKASDTQTSLVVNIPVLSQGLSYHAISSAKKEILKSHYSRLDTSSKVKERITMAWNSLQSYNSLIDSNAEAESLYMTVLDGVRKEYELRLAPLPDMLQAKEDLLGVKIKLVEAKADRNLAFYRLLQEIGILNDTFQHLST